MRTVRSLISFLAICLISTFQFAEAQNSKPLDGVTVVQVEPTVISNPAKVKEEHAANLVADSLRNALKFANIEVGDSPIRAHIVLDEFTSGSTAKRVMIGFGAGRSTVDCRLVLQDASGKELVNKKIRVRGNLAWSPYQGNNTQRRQAVTSFEQRLLEEIETLRSSPVATQSTTKAQAEAVAKPAAQKETGTLSITSDPNGAEVYIDNEFAGNTPCKLTVDAGKHTIKVTAKDYKDWSRDMTIREGSEITVNAGLEK